MHRSFALVAAALVSFAAAAWSVFAAPPNSSVAPGTLRVSTQMERIWAPDAVLRSDPMAGQDWLRPEMPIAQLIVEEVKGLPFENYSQFQNQTTPAGEQGEVLPSAS